MFIGGYQSGIHPGCLPNMAVRASVLYSSSHDTLPCMRALIELNKPMERGRPFARIGGFSLRVPGRAWPACYIATDCIGKRHTLARISCSWKEGGQKQARPSHDQASISRCCERILRRRPARAINRTDYAAEQVMTGGKRYKGTESLDCHLKLWGAAPDRSLLLPTVVRMPCFPVADSAATG